MEQGHDLEKKIAGVLNDKNAVLGIMKPVIDTYDVHADIPWPGLYRQLAECYPTSRFIYIERDVDQWWRSLEAHWSLLMLSRRLRPFELVQYQPFLPPDMRVVGKADELVMKDAFLRHRKDVIAAIPADRLLLVDLKQAAAAQQLTGFFGVQGPVELRQENKRWPAWMRLLRNVNSNVKNRIRFGMCC